MKNIILSFFMLSAFASIAQTNTFPSSGNVGIGTTSPTSKLHVNQLSNFDWSGYFYNGGADGRGIRVESLSTNPGVSLFEVEGSGLGGSYFSVRTGGKVGIGTLTPNSLLHVKQLSEASTLSSQGFLLQRAGGSSTSLSIGFLNTGKAVLNTDATQFDVNASAKLTLNATQFINFTSSGSASQGAFAFKGLGADEFVKFHAITKNVIIGGAGADPATSTRLDIRGLGTTTGTALRVADNTNTERLTVLDNGATTVSGPLTVTSGSLTLSNVGSMAAFQQWNPYSNNTESIMTIPSGSTDQGLVIRGFGPSVTALNYDAISFGNTSYVLSSGSGGQFRSLKLSPTLNLTGSYSGTVIGIDYNPTVASLTGVTHIAANFAKGQIRLGEISNDDGLTQVLVRDGGTGELKYRDASTLTGSSPLWSSSGTNAFYDSGNIGIGISNPQNKLDVNGTIHSKEVKVDLSNWPDYVFDENYEIPSVDELKSFIRMYKHLPDVPTAREVDEKGVMLGEMNRLLLEKIEAMTLYIIDQKEQSDKQLEMIRQLQSEVRALKENNK